VQKESATHTQQTPPSSLSSDGSTLYYGDIFGTINALEVADSVTLEPSPAPTFTPSVVTTVPTPSFPPPSLPPSLAPLATTSSPVVAQTQESYEVLATTAPVNSVDDNGTQTSSGSRRLATAWPLLATGCICTVLSSAV